MKNMLGRIKFNNYERCYPSRLKNLFQSDMNYHTAYENFALNAKRGTVGNIPKEIIELFPENVRGEKIKQFQTALSNITKYLRSCYFSTKEQNLIQHSFFDLGENLKVFEESISNIMNKCLKGVMSDIGQLDAKLSFAGRGAAKNVFKLSLKDANGNKIMHDKAFAVYHYPSRIGYFGFMHNNCAEANFWTFMKNAAGHKLDKTQFTKHYISDVKSGYALTDFIDYQIPKTAAPMDLEKVLHIEYVDKENIPIAKKYYDAGGFVKIDNELSDKIVRRYFKKLYYRSPKELPQVLASLEAKVQNPKTPHRDKIQKAIELFKH